MSKLKTGLATAGLLGAAALGIVGLHDATNNEIITAYIETARPARLSQEAPAGTCVHQTQMLDDAWLCMVHDDEPLDNEETLPPGHAYVMWICPVDANHDEVWVQWAPSNQKPDPKCKAAELQPGCAALQGRTNFPGVTMPGVNLLHKECLDLLCAPCVVGVGDDWGHCPRCWMRGDCATMCTE